MNDMAYPTPGAGALSVGPGTERDYVSLGRRTVAALVDNVFWLILYVWFLAPIVASVHEESPGAAGVIVIAYLSLWFNYFAFAEWRWGQTMGKNAVGIMVTTTDGGPLTFGQASTRGLLRLIDWLVIGWVMVATGERRQRLGDKAAHTVVVGRPSRTGATMQRAPVLEARQMALAAEPPPAEPSPTEPALGPAPSGTATPSDSASPGAPAPPPGPPPGQRGRLPDISWSVKRTVAGLFLGLILGMFAPLLVLPFDPDLESEGAILAAQALFGLCLLAVPLYIASERRRAGLRVALGRLGVRRFAPSALGWALLALVGYYVFAALFSALVLEPKQDDIGGDLGVGDETFLVALLAVLLIVVLAPVSEEIFFRGFFFSGLRTKLPFLPAALIGGLAFGLVHLPTGVTTVVPLAVLGGVLCWVYERTGSLWPAIAIHMVNNGLALLIIS